MSESTYGALFSLGLFTGMLLFAEVGRRIGMRWMADGTGASGSGRSLVENAVLALLGLILAFTFSGAALRFDARRKLVVEEANAIGTAWLRLDLLPATAQSVERDLFRRYLDSRLAIYRALPDIEAAYAALPRATNLQAEIWKHAVAACEERHDPSTTSLVLSSLNAMFDIATSRTEATKVHPPRVIFVLLGSLAFACALVAGYGIASGRKRRWGHVVGFAAVISLSVYVIVELEFPRMGFVTVSDSDQLLEDLRASMK